MNYDATSNNQHENINHSETMGARTAHESVENEDFENSDTTVSGKSSSEHALEIRRAIEDRLERNRLQKEYNYLFDDNLKVEDIPGDEEES